MDWYRLNDWLIDYGDSSVADSCHCINILYYTENVFIGHFIITVFINLLLFIFCEIVRMQILPSFNCFNLRAMVQSSLINN